MADSKAPKLLNRNEIIRLTGLSRATIDRLRNAGSFPKPVQLSQRRIAWRANDISEWVETRRHTSPVEGNEVKNHA